MTVQNFTVSFTVKASPEVVFGAINDVRAWWSGQIDGETDELEDEFTYRYEDVHYSKQRVSELVANERVAWHVVDSALSFVADTTEWNGSDIVFDISAGSDGTQVRFTHEGLVPNIECFEKCSNAWSFIIGDSLRNFILNGVGETSD